MSHALTSIADLLEAEYNPRTITDEAALGLRHSLREFGDLSGIVWNSRSGRLVAGHQRLRQLKVQYGKDLRLVEHEGSGTSLHAPNGDVFRIRVVDWDETWEKAANLAANNPAIAGVFTEEVTELLEEIEREAPDLYDEVLLDRIVAEPTDEELAEEEAEPAEPETGGPPEMELQPFEHYDYVLVLCRTRQDWEYLVEKLAIGRVDSAQVPGHKRIGLGRAINAERLIRVLEGRPPEGGA